MWLKGDLKDRLGIAHRRDRKKQGKLEQTPMFHQPHIRSESEISQPDEYGTPLAYTPPTSRTPVSDGSPRTTAPLMAGESPRPDKLEEGLHPPTRSAGSSPSPTPPRAQYNASPLSQRISYYSVSNFPSPSPIPEANRYHYTRSQYGDTQPPMSAVSHTSVSYNQQPSSPAHISPPPSASLQVPGQRSPHAVEQFEMHVRSQPQEQWVTHPGDPLRSVPAIHTPMATEDSFSTALDEQDVDDAAYDIITPTATRPVHEQEVSWRSSTYSYSGAHAI